MLRQSTKRNESSDQEEGQRKTKYALSLERHGAALDNDDRSVRSHLSDVVRVASAYRGEQSSVA